MEHRHNSTLSPLNSMLVPYDHRQLPEAPSIAAASRSGIPRGWGVEQVPRADGSRSDTYYYEPGTGRKFKSIVGIRRYLNEGVSTRRSTRISTINNNNSGYRRLLPSSQKNGCRRMIAYGGKLFKMDKEVQENNLAIVATEKPAPIEPFILPDGWIVEEVPRKYDNSTDKYYYEPGTGQKFRSLVAIERYLAELEENAPLSKTLEQIKENQPLSKVFKLENHSKKSTPMKKNISQENNNTEASSIIGPPMKVNWVLASPQGDVWNPFISDMLVADSVKQQWAKRFMLYMSDGVNDQSCG